MVNTYHLNIMPLALESLRKAGPTDDRIARRTSYKGQLRLSRRLKSPDLSVQTVDASQGEGYNFIILDLAIPEGLEYTLDFVADILTDVRRSLKGQERSYDCW